MDYYESNYEREMREEREGGQVDDDLIEACRYGNLQQCKDTILAGGCGFFPCMEMAAICGHLNILNHFVYLLRKRERLWKGNDNIYTNKIWDIIINAAAIYGQVHVMKYIFNNFQPKQIIDTELIKYAITRGHINVIKYFYHHSKYISTACWYEVSRMGFLKGNLQLIDWAIKNGVQIHKLPRITFILLQRTKPAVRKLFALISDGKYLIMDSSFMEQSFKDYIYV
mgnify:CR=1 FL=1